MKLVKFQNEKEAGAYLGQMIIDIVKANPKAVLGLATGSTPIPAYQYIAEHKGDVSFKDVVTFNLDEYLDCSIQEQTYRQFMHDNLFSKIDIDEKNTHFPDRKELDAYDELIDRAGGIDIQVLGIGNNGHIGFNEPGTEADAKTHVVELTESTIQANKRFFNDDVSLVPTHAVTMGLGTIRKAKKIVLMATTKSKHDAIVKTLGGSFDKSCPASVLFDHQDTDIVVTNEVID